jgi:SAM-dependent methyltransferase
MPDIKWNDELWGCTYDWTDSGEEWSARWGGSEAQWFGALFPRLHRLLPASRILEIAPGYGRWSRYLIPACSGYLGIDLSAACVDACRTRFRGAPHALFLQNDGRSLNAAPDGSFDFIFSFDSLVHVESDVLQYYIPQLIKKLCPNGVAFLHHSNLLDFDNPQGLQEHARATSVSGRVVAELVAKNGGRVIVQEVISWVDTGLLDCLTTFGRADDCNAAEPVNLVNPHFMKEATIIREFQSRYCKIR